MKRVLQSTDIRPDARREVSEELRFHIEMRTREFMEQGMSREDAARAAVASFGDVGAITRELETARGDRNRERSRRDWWRGVSLDVRYAVRALRKRPVFAAAAILTIALGIGATTAIFTVVNGVLVRPLPYAAPDRLALVWLRPDQMPPSVRWPLTSGMYLDLAARVQSMESVAAFRGWTQALREGEVSEPLAGARVTPSLFPTLGVRPLLGRTLEPADTMTGAPAVTVISHNLWQRRFAGNPSIIGRAITLNNVHTVVVGVMPPGFAFPRGAELPSSLVFGRRTDVWVPMPFSQLDAQNYGTMNISMVGRVRSGVTTAAAEQDVDATLAGILQQIGARMKLTARVVTLQEQAAEPVARGLVIILVGVGLLLVIACVNVTNLLVARTAERGRELAVRTALGAKRSRVGRQLLTENLLLSGAGAALGVAVAAWTVRVLLSLVPGTLPRADDVAVDWRVALFAGGLTMTLVIVLSLATLFTFSRTSMQAALHDGNSRSSSGPRARLGRRSLVTLQIALSLVLLIGAGLLITSFVNLLNVDMGFNPNRAVAADVGLPLGQGFNPREDGPVWMRFFEQIEEHLKSVPGVEAVGGVSALPLSGTIEASQFFIQGEPDPGPGKRTPTDYAVVTGDYFRAAGISLREGRAFDARDRTDGPRVVIVNSALAKRYFPNASPVGRFITCGCEFYAAGPREIVGVVNDVKMRGLPNDVGPAVYLPETQAPYPGLGIVVRSQLSNDEAIAAIRRAVQATDPKGIVNNTRSLEGLVKESMSAERFGLVLVGSFAVAALLLAVLGLYGIVVLGVEQRRRELGVRLALGARPSDLRRLVVREGMAMTLVGIAVGVALATGVTRTLSELLFGVNPRHAGVFAACCVVVSAVALIASYLPAQRATRVDAAETLRAN